MHLVGAHHAAITLTDEGSQLSRQMSRRDSLDALHPTLLEIWCIDRRRNPVSALIAGNPECHDTSLLDCSDRRWTNDDAVPSQRYASRDRVPVEVHEIDGQRSVVAGQISEPAGLLMTFALTS